MDFTTEQGRAQAYADSAASAEQVRLVEKALLCRDNDRIDQALEALHDADTDCIFGDDRSDEFDRLLDALAKVLPDGIDDPLYRAFLQVQSEAIAAQAKTDQMVDHVIKILEGR